MKYIVPSTGILARLKHKIENFVKEEYEKGLSIEDMVNIVTMLPRFAQLELWNNLHEGSNLDVSNNRWLIEQIERHSHSYLEHQSTRLYAKLRYIFVQ